MSSKKFKSIEDMSQEDVEIAVEAIRTFGKAFVEAVTAVAEVIAEWAASDEAQAAFAALASSEPLAGSSEEDGEADPAGEPSGVVVAGYPVLPAPYGSRGMGRSIEDRVWHEDQSS